MGAIITIYQQFDHTFADRENQLRKDVKKGKNLL